jgi:hypothetical protein
MTRTADEIVQPQPKLLWKGLEDDGRRRLEQRPSTGIWSPGSRKEAEPDRRRRSGIPCDRNPRSIIGPSAIALASSVAVTLSKSCPDTA